MFPHVLDENGHPKEGLLRGSRTTLQCYDDGRLVNHGSITLKLQHYSKCSFQDHHFYVVETLTQKEIIVGHPCSVRLGLIKVLCKNIAKTVSSIETASNNLNLKHINGKSQKRSNSHPNRDRMCTTETSKGQWRMSKSDRDEASSPHMIQTGTDRYISRTPICHPLSRPHMSRSDMTRHVSKSNRSFKTLTKQVRKLNSKYLVLSNETTLVISDPEMAKRSQPKEQSTAAPQKGLRFNPIYMEPGKVSINSTSNLQAMYLNSFNRIGDMSGEYDIKTDPFVPPVQHDRCKVPIECKAEIKKTLDKMVQQGIIAKQTEQIPWVSLLTYPKKPNGKLKICLDPKDLNKAIIHKNHKAPTLEEIAHVLTGATKFSKVDGNKAFFGLHLTEEALLLTTFNTHLGSYHFL